MRAKALRELQQQGEKAISSQEPILLTNRKGPVGVLIPVTQESLPFLQAETEKWMALQSLKKTWALAREVGLDQLSLEEINQEVKQARRKIRKK
ncbi:MAG: hypothetical protein ABIQ95_08195 [Bdellovibrionia bacterium]